MPELSNTPAFAHSPYVPFDPRVLFYDYSPPRYAPVTYAPFTIPTEYSGWRSESLTWKKTAYLHGNLNPMPTYRVTGRQALECLEFSCVNSFETFAVGGSKHVVMCNERGNVMTHGMLLRLAEDEFVSYGLAPYIQYAVEQSGYEAAGEDLSGELFLFQLGGPRSLEILETATGEDMRDIRFLRHRDSRIADTDVRILRVGMAGTLAYEVHGPVAAAHAVNAAIFKAGQRFGLERLGYRTYMCQHTENGFPQYLYHFPLAIDQDTGYSEWLENTQNPFPRVDAGLRLRGSVGRDLEARYVNPFALGWGHLVRFDHEFRGRKELEREADQPRRTMVTLEWNPEDVADVFASQFGANEGFLQMEMPNHYPREIGDSSHQRNLWADWVRKDGKNIGVSSGRTFTAYYGQMISLCSLEVSEAKIGSELTVLWGEPGMRQKEIRVEVTRFPYLNEARNENIDVSTLTQMEALT